MKAKSVDHIGIATKSLEEGIAFYQKNFAAELGERETIESQGVEVCFLGVPGQSIELLAPIAGKEQESSLTDFLEKRGPGLHHICFEVEDIEAALKEHKAAGHRLIDEKPRHGARGSRIAFIHPKSCQGTLIELCDYPDAS